MDDSTEDFPTKSFALTGKVMLITIIFLFSVMIIMIFLHLYIRWYLSRLRLRSRGSRSRRRSRLIFYAFDDGPTSPSPRGLDPYVLASIPVFPYSRGARTVPTDCGELECAVCLSEFEGGEKVRLLPKCDHCFHVECIDMWFHSHSTCPLCRLPVEPPPPEENVSCVGGPGRPEPDSSSGPCVACSTSTGHRRKDFAVGRVTIEVPRRTGFDNDIETSSPASSGFRSPAARLLSLTRILSMSRRSAAVSPSAGVGSSRDPVAAGELDLEGGRDESTQQQTWTRTPR